MAPAEDSKWTVSRMVVFQPDAVISTISPEGEVRSRRMPLPLAATRRATVTRPASREARASRSWQILAKS